MAVNADAVRQILDTSLEDSQLDVFITGAQTIIGPDGCDLASTLADETVDEICRWLAAHLATVADPRVESSRASGHSVDFRGDTGMGLKTSMYGQQAKLLDPTGCLAALDREGRLPFLFSTTRGDQTDAEVQPFFPRGGFGFP